MKILIKRGKAVQGIIVIAPTGENDIWGSKQEGVCPCVFEKYLLIGASEKSNVSLLH